MTDATARAAPRSLGAGFAAGAGVGMLGGLIGLGGAELRLPLLIGVFGFLAQPAVARAGAGRAAGLGIGVVAALMGSPAG